MSSYTALFDASVLYPATIRDVLMQLAITDLFRAKWTADIHDEWIRSLRRDRPQLRPEDLQRTRTLMDTAVRDCLVTGYEQLIPSLNLPDPDDCHVLAAAIAGRCDVIVTQNLKHFPETSLAPYGLEAQHPDEFLSNHLNLAPGLFCDAIRMVRARLKNPPFTAPQYLDVLTQNGLVATASELVQFSTLI
jgi:predicted nucleic acid-binding protein